jgi:beta-lactamase class A
MNEICIEGSMSKEKINRIQSFKQNLEQIIDSKVGWIAISFYAPEQDIYLGINDTMSVHAASTMKVAVMAAIFNQVEASKIQLTDQLVIKNEFKSIIDGSIYTLNISDDSSDKLYRRIGSKMTIRDLITDMITVSGNLSTNILIEAVGAGHVYKLMKNIGADNLKILRGVEDIKAFRAGKNNSTTANALTRLFTAILDNEICSAKNSKQMIDVLVQQKFKDKLPALLPQKIKIAHKTGSITAINHDSGIIFPAGKPPYILTVLTRGFSKPDQAKQTIAEISKLIYDWYQSN